MLLWNLSTSVILLAREGSENWRQNNAKLGVSRELFMFLKMWLCIDKYRKNLNFG